MRRPSGSCTRAKFSQAAPFAALCLSKPVVLNQCCYASSVNQTVGSVSGPVRNSVVSHPALISVCSLIKWKYIYAHERRGSGRWSLIAELSDLSTRRRRSPAECASGRPDGCDESHQ